MNQKSQETSRTELSVRGVAGVLFRHRGLALTTFLTTALLTTLATSLMPDRYESRMKILVKNTRADVVVTPERTDGSTRDTDVTEAQVNSELELLASKDMLEQVVRECDLARRADGGEPTPAETEEAVRQLEKDLTIKPVKRANIIELVYVARAPEQAAAVLRKLGESYLDKHLRLHRPPGTYEFFRGQAERYGVELRDAEARLADFQRRLQLVSIDEQKNLNLRRAAEAETKLAETDAALGETSKRAAVIENQLRTLDPRIVTQSRALPNQYSAERLNTMLVELRNRRTQLLTKFKPDDRFVREVDQQIADTSLALRRAEQQTAVEQSTDVNPLRQQLQSELARAQMDAASLQARRASLAVQVNDYRGLLAQLEGATVTHDDLVRQVRTAEENLQLYARKRDEARIADALDERKITNVAIAESPTTPALPTRPHRKTNFALGLLFAAVMSVGSVCCAEFFRETLVAPEELEQVSGLPTLATVPYDPRV